MMRVVVAALLLMASACGLTTAAVWLLAGLPWALLALGGWSLLGGVVLLRGAMSNG